MGNKYWIGKRVRIIKAAGLPWPDSEEGPHTCADPTPEHIDKEGTIVALDEDFFGSPKIELDDGSIVWGYECWWVPLGWKVHEEEKE